MTYISLPTLVASNLEPDASHKSLATYICKYASTNLSTITLRTAPRKTTVASLNVFSCLGVIVPVGVTPATQNMFTVVSHKVVLVCQCLKFFPRKWGWFQCSDKDLDKNLPTHIRRIVE